MKGLLGIVLLLLFIACNRVGDKSRELAGKAARIAEEKAGPLLDSTLNKLERRRQKYFGATPDSTKHREMYAEFFKQAPTADVALDTTFHSYLDYLGADFTEQLSFRCSPETARRLMKELQLQRAKESDVLSYGFRDDLDWWDASRLEKLEAWCLIRDTQQSYQYAWHDEARRTFYYLNFST